MTDCLRNFDLLLVYTQRIWSRVDAWTRESGPVLVPVGEDFDPGVYISKKDSRLFLMVIEPGTCFELQCPHWRMRETLGDRLMEAGQVWIDKIRSRSQPVTSDPREIVAVAERLMQVVAGQNLLSAVTLLGRISLALEGILDKGHHPSQEDMISFLTGAVSSPLWVGTGPFRPILMADITGDLGSYCMHMEFNGAGSGSRLRTVKIDPLEEVLDETFLRGLPAEDVDGLWEWVAEVAGAAEATAMRLRNALCA